MLEKEQRYVDALRSELAKNNNPKAQQELVGAERRVRTLQEQLRNLIANSADHEVSACVDELRINVYVILFCR